MVTLEISGYDATRVFIDTGSSVDIMLHNYLDKMILNEALQPIDTTLYGFAGGVIQPLGQITLQVRLVELPL